MTGGAMMDKKNQKKEFFLVRWCKRMFLGSSRELTVSDERYDSPGKLAVKRFFRKPLATIAVIVLLMMFAFVFIGPLFAPVDLSYMESMHPNVAPTHGMMAIPGAMKDGTATISSRGTFTLGLSTEGKLYTWGYYGGTLKNKPQTNVLTIPEEAKQEKIMYAAAGSDHCVAIGESGKVYTWGQYDNGQYGHDGSMIAAVLKQPNELINGKIDATKVKQLAVGVQVTAILMEDGTLYAWGNDQAGATNMQSILSAIKKDGLRLSQIVFTNTGLFAVSTEGEFVTGNNTTFDSYTAKDENGANQIVKTRDYIGDRKIVSMAGTGDSLAVVLDDGEMLVFGKAGEAPELPEGEKAVSVSAGSRHFTMLTDKGRVLAWGNGKLGQTNVPKKLQAEGSVDQVISSGFQNYAFKDGKFVGSWGLKGYLMGTDEMGRDVFNRVMNGGKMTMTVGAVAVIVATIIGVIIGCISGYFGGKVDMLLMRVTEIFGAIPFLPFALVLSAILQSSDLNEDMRIFIIMLILGVLSWTGLARLIRGQVLAEREKEFVTAARSMGVKEKRIAFKHILPNVISVILVSVTLDFASCMLTESSLSYLGFGVQLPRPTWGNMLYGCRNATVIQNYWWRWLFPAIFLSVAVICINVIGDSLRDVLDPKSEVEK